MDGTVGDFCHHVKYGEVLIVTNTPVTVQQNFVKFHKLCCRIWLNLPLRNMRPDRWFTSIPLTTGQHTDSCQSVAVNLFLANNQQKWQAKTHKHNKMICYFSSRRSKLNLLIDMQLVIVIGLVFHFIVFLFIICCWSGKQGLSLSLAAYQSVDLVLIFCC